MNTSAARRSLSLLAACLLSLALGAPSQAEPGGFRAGELLLVSSQLPNGVDSGVLRIDPVSGATELLVDLGSLFTFGSFACYDPWRDRLIVRAIVGSVQEFWTVDADGNLGTLAHSYPNAVRPAPTGDGRIYLSLPDNGLGISWLDTSDVAHVLLDQAGTGPFQLQPPFAVGAIGMIYDPGTNSLLLSSAGNANPCAGGLASAVHVHKIPLSLDGTRAGGPASCVDYDVLTGQFGDIPVGWGRGPGGELLLVVNTSPSTGALDRMLRVDPVTLAITSYSKSSGLGSNGLTAGTYSRLLDRAVVMDSAQMLLRSYPAGGSGGGIVIPTGLLAGSELIEVGPIAPTYGLRPDVASISLSAGGTQTLSHDYGPAHAGEVHVVLGSAAGWNPGFYLDGVLLPIFFDTYTLFTAQFPNAAPLVNSLGVLDGQGRGTSAFTLPSGFSPSLAGATLHHASLVWSPLSFTTVHASNPVPLRLDP